MLSCEDVDRRLTAYLDAEVDGVERRGIEQHLTACPPCSRRAAAEQTAKRVVAVRARALSLAHAPAGLRARCAALAPSSVGASPPAFAAWWSATAWRRLGLASAAVAVLLFAVLAVGVVSHSPTLLAAELRLDHMKCFAFFEPRAAHADPLAVAAQLEHDYGWRCRVPGSEPAQRLTLLGARRCLSTDGQVAHVLYRHGGRPVSLFMVPQTSHPETRVDVAGRVAVIWSSDKTTFVALGDESEHDLQPVFEYLKAETRRTGQASGS
jgi:anti-sigma factor (TIGR02949 family)